MWKSKAKFTKFVSLELNCKNGPNSLNLQIAGALSSLGMRISHIPETTKPIWRNVNVLRPLSNHALPEIGLI